MTSRSAISPILPSRSRYKANFLTRVISYNWARVAVYGTMAVRQDPLRALVKSWTNDQLFTGEIGGP